MPELLNPKKPVGAPRGLLSRGNSGGGSAEGDASGACLRLETRRKNKKEQWEQGSTYKRELIGSAFNVRETWAPL